MKKKRPKTSADSAVGASDETIEVAGSPIPSRYLSGIDATTDPFDPPKAHRLRVYVVGQVGTGKTALACSIPDAHIFDAQDKSSGVSRLAPGSLVARPRSLKELRRRIDLLVNDGPKKSGFRTVVFDPLSTIVYGLIATGLADEKNVDDIGEYGREGKGWRIVNNEFVDWYERLWLAGYGVWCFGHITPPLSKGGEFKHEVTPGVRAYLISSSEFHFMTSVRAVTVPRKVKDGRGRSIVRSDRVARYFLDMIPILDPDADKFHARQHIPMIEDSIVHKEGHGYDSFRAVYESSVKDRAATIRGRRSKKPSIGEPK